MPEPALRALLALLVALVGGALLTQLPPRVPRDLVLTVYALLAGVLGVFAVMGLEAAVIAGSVLAAVFVLGACVYALVAAVGSWAGRA